MFKGANITFMHKCDSIQSYLVNNGAAADPIARTTALISLVCVLMSLLFGSLYIIRFGTMRKMYKAASWADKYGDAMDTRWKKKVAGWRTDDRSGTLKASDEAEDSTWMHGSPLPRNRNPEPYGSLAPVREESLPDQPQDEPPSDLLNLSPFLSHNNPSETTLSSESFSPFPAVKLMRLSHESTFVCPIPALLADRWMAKQHWWQLATELNAYKHQMSDSLRPILSSLTQWNRTYFAPHCTEAVLCMG
ncbi:hypothetical protein K438DRAFT_1781362 [Mycena galopus ATCC 62051]|nr:hypothetical protein K438DRAFT_1781362 [Mycena galopus ATCC 62051]